MTYTQLNIHHKINAKSNSIVYYYQNSRNRPALMRYMGKKDPDLFYPVDKMIDRKVYNNVREPKGAGRAKY